MADATTTARELNRLYWESELSISDIADRLDISRRALYDGIRPYPAGEPCPECGTELGYRNRTALENGEAECPNCGYETELDADGAPSGARPADGHPPRVPSRPVPRMGSGPVLGTAFLTGLALGALAASVFHRR